MNVGSGFTLELYFMGVWWLDVAVVKGVFRGCGNDSVFLVTWLLAVVSAS